MSVAASILVGAVTYTMSAASTAQIGLAPVSTVLSGGMVANDFASVPQRFEPNTATDQELFEYGYPARPDPSDAAAQALWQKAVHLPRVSAGLVENAGKIHQAAQSVQLSPNTSSTSTSTSTNSLNWSAVAIDSKTAYFTNIIGFWAVPNVASQVAGLDNGYSSMWIGLDGLNLGDLIAIGTESDWVGGVAKYYAWVEVLPGAEVIQTGLPINPGDGIYAATQYKVVSGKASAYFFMSNFNTGKSVSTSIVFPTTLKFTGQSAEWVVDRPEVNGALYPLPNYGLAFMSGAYAQRCTSSTFSSCSATLYYPNPTPTDAKLVSPSYLNMYNATSQDTLSTPFAQGDKSIRFDWDQEQ